MQPSSSAPEAGNRCWIPLPLEFSELERSTLLVPAVAELSTATANGAEEIRCQWFAAIPGQTQSAQKLRTVISVFVDLRRQGWSLRTIGGTVEVLPVELDFTAGRTDEKDRLRTAHLQERDAQLREGAVRSFVEDMERPKIGPAGWVSIFDLMRDGRELAASLQRAADQPGEDRLCRVVDPYLQVVDDGNCQFTGLRLLDIWRYFRHTWVTPYKSVPGRQLCFLIRDRAAPKHPVIGIAAYGSPVVGLTKRDQWIGWTSEEFPRLIESRREINWSEWLEESLSAAIESIFVDDFVRSGVLHRDDLSRPSSTTLSKLRLKAEYARSQHRLMPQLSLHKTVDHGDTDWRTLATSHLYTAKRAETLAELLSTRAALRAGGVTARSSADDLLRSTWSVRRAIETVLRHVKSRHVGINLVDLSVCGAVAPYNVLLGGKLIALHSVGPEAVAAYETRYATAVSVIASSMAGRPIRRKPSLALVGTTSLYGVAASQYNRIKVACEALGGHADETIEFKNLGLSKGQGSYHLSDETIRQLQRLIAQEGRGRRVNSVFGEGVSPRLRKIRQGLELAGLPPDVVLTHRSPRIVYGVALCRNFRELLLGLCDRPNRLLPTMRKREIGDAISRFWRKRWLEQRIARPGILDAVANHTLVRPITHGARVVLPEGEAVQLPLEEIG